MPRRTPKMESITLRRIESAPTITLYKLVIPTWVMTIPSTSTSTKPAFLFRSLQRETTVSQGVKEMLISEAKAYIGQMVNLVYRDRKGDEISQIAEIFDVGFVALYGPCLMTDMGEIRIDRVVSVMPFSMSKAA